MSLGKLASSPKSVPSALALLIVGLMLPTCSGPLRGVLATSLRLSLNQVDFAKGFLIGLGLTLEICALVILAAHLRCRRSL